MSPAPFEQADLTHWQGEPIGVWEAVWGIPRFEAWTELDSTNDRARDLVLEGAAPWTTVVALSQTTGRGRGGRAWQSSPNAGLWASTVLLPRAAAQGQLVPLLAGLALTRSIDAGLDPGAARPSGVALKWPNDVWWDDRKIAGILCETVARSIVVGLGVNLRTPDEGFVGDHATRAGALDDLADGRWSASWLLGRWIRELRALWEPPRLRIDAELAEEWRSRDLLRGQLVRVGGIAGRARGITADGALRIETDSGEVLPVMAGHVEWGGETRPAQDPDLAEE